MPDAGMFQNPRGESWLGAGVAISGGQYALSLLPEGETRQDDQRDL